MKKLAWFALETMGDNPETCDVFEIAVVVTDVDLLPLKEFQSAVMGAKDTPLTIQMRVGGDTRDRLTANGLWDEMTRSSVTPLSIEHNLTRMFTPQRGDEPFIAICSAWDRTVMQQRFPAAGAILAPSSWDVDSFVGLSQTFVPRARVEVQPARERVGARLSTEMQNLASVVNALRGAKGKTTS